MSATTLFAATSSSGGTDTGAEIVFWSCAVLAVIGALGMLLSRKPVHSALFVALTMINLAILYVALQAPFLGMVQVIVYTGAVMMLFVFVMMIVGVDSSDSLIETIKGQRWAAVILVFGFAAFLIGAIVNGMQGVPDPSLEAANSQYGGNLQGLAKIIFTDYVVAFEVTSALLIVAALGAMLLAHRERHTPKATQEQRSKARFARYAATGELPGNLPPAGTYARHNAIDTPALAPDGSVVPESVPGPLQERGSVRPVDVAAEVEVDELAEGNTVVALDDDEAGEQR